MIGKKITQPGKIVELMYAGKAIYLKHMSRCLPAAIIINWPLIMVINLIKNNSIFEYKANKK